MDARVQRGMEIAATTELTKTDKGYLVPSQTGKGLYLVSMGGEKPKCTCPDWKERKEPCKHVFAVEFTQKRETKPDGTVTETKSMKVTFGQDWHHYNEAQINEQHLFVDLLKRLCAGIPQPEQHMGRKKMPLSDSVFASVYKVYSTMSGRRFTSDIRDAKEQGLTTVAPHYSTTSRTLEDATLTPLLKQLVALSALPLKEVESDFAVDSTGFTTAMYARWFDHKWGKERTKQTWIKCHLMCGVKTNIVTSVEATATETADVAQFPQLVNKTAENFTVKEISADKVYGIRKTYHVADLVGATAYIPFKKGHTGLGNTFDPLWNKMHAFYQFNRAEFLKHYGKRSNVESTMWMIKSKFGANVRSKTATAQVNEVLCKVLCHNICVLIASMYELGIAPQFKGEVA